MAKANFTTLPEGADFSLRGTLCIEAFRRTVLIEHHAKDGFSYAMSADVNAEINEHLAAIERLLINDNVRRRPTHLRVVSGGLMNSNI